MNVLLIYPDETDIFRHRDKRLIDKINVTMITDANSQEQTKPYRLFLRKFQHDWSFVLSGMLAFNFLIALLPMAIILFGIVGLVLGNNVHLQNRLKNQLLSAFPPKANESLNEIINLAFERLYHDATLMLSIGIILAIIGCLRLFIAIDRCLTIIYRIEERTFFKRYLRAGQMLLLFLLLIPLMIIISAIPSVFLGQISSPAGQVGTYILGIFIGLLVTFILFEVIYFFIPNKKMQLKQTWFGSIVAAGALQWFMILFPLYVRSYSTSNTGRIGFVVILILFLFYFAILLISGAQINAFFFEHIQPLSHPLGTFLFKSALNCDGTRNS